MEEATSTQRIRDRLLIAITCTECGSQKYTFTRLAHEMNARSTGIRGQRMSADLVSQFLKGGDLRTSQLDLVEWWLLRDAK